MLTLPNTTERELAMALKSTTAMLGVAGALLATCLVSSPLAAADAPPNCSPADMAGIASGVAASASAYLFTHPDLNDFYASLRGRPQEEVADAVRKYFADNPQQHNDIRGIRAPLTDFRERCGLTDPDRGLLGQS